MSDHLRHGNEHIRAELAALMDEPESGLHSSFEEWSAEQRNSLRWQLVNWRDTGRSKDAVKGLSLANRVWPTDPIFLLELLVIKSYASHLIPNELIENQADETLLHPPVMLFLALQAGHDGQADASRAGYDAITAQGIESISPFQSHYYQLAEIALLNTARETLHRASVGAPETPLFDRPETQLLIDALGYALLSADSTKSILQRVREIAFANTYALPDPIKLCMVAFDHIHDRLTLDGKLAQLALLEAMKPNDNAALIANKLMADEQTRTSAAFARLGATLASRRRDAVLERSILVRYEPNVFDATDAHKVEVSKRRQAVNADRSLNVFIGLFGQMRDPDQVLPSTIAALRHGFNATACGPFNLYFGLSAWAKTGRRPLSQSDGTGFYLQAAPPKLRPLMEVGFGANGQELATTFPNLIAAMVAHGNAPALQEPTEVALKALMPPGSSVILASEAIVEAEVRATLAMGQCEGAWGEINQFKMWARIAGLKQTLHQQETALGRPVDACVFLRCDLTNLHGQLAEAAVRVASAYDQTTVFYDYDGHAEFIGGAGDRYMVMSRASANILFQGYADILATHATTNPQEATLRPRIRAHEGLASLIFKSGLTAAPIGALHYEIYRGAPPLPVLIKALQDDLEASPHPLARDAIQNVLTTLTT